MTNVQLYLTIGIPSILVVLAWINSNSRLDRIDRRLDTIESDLKQFYRTVGKLEGRLDAVEHK